jgi:hypothetical protein
VEQNECRGLTQDEDREQGGRHTHRAVLPESTTAMRTRRPWTFRAQRQSRLDRSLGIAHEDFSCGRAPRPSAETTYGPPLPGFESRNDKRRPKSPSVVRWISPLPQTEVRARAKATSSHQDS